MFLWNALASSPSRYSWKKGGELKVRPSPRSVKERLKWPPAMEVEVEDLPPPVWKRLTMTEGGPNGKTLNSK